jgi:hypothetical protein
MGCRIGAKLALKRTAQLLLIAIAEFYGDALQGQIGFFGLDTQRGPWHMENGTGASWWNGRFRDAPPTCSILLVGPRRKHCCKLEITRRHTGSGKATMLG